MRTTVRLDDQLLRDAKRTAAEESKTLTALIDESLRERIARSRPESDRARVSLPTCPGDGLVEGIEPGVLFNNARLADLMDGLD